MRQDTESYYDCDYVVIIASNTIKINNVSFYEARCNNIPKWCMNAIFSKL